MKQIILNTGEIVLVDDADFAVVNKNKWQLNGSITRYASRTDYKTGKKVWMHRVIAKTPVGMSTDHINGNKLDNRRENLRVATSSQNKHNRGKQLNNTSGYKGVVWVSDRVNKTNKWVAQICANGKRKRIGYFKTIEEAAKAYDKVALELHGDFAKLNFSY